MASFFLPSPTLNAASVISGCCTLFSKSNSGKGGLFYLKQNNIPIYRGRRRGVVVNRICYMAFLCVCLSVCFCMPASATTIWEKASEIMQDVYSQILAISTVAAIVTASVALLMTNFSRSNRTVDESRAWLKRIVITWAILNGLGFIMSYVTPFFAGGQWTPTTTT